MRSLLLLLLGARAEPVPTDLDDLVDAWIAEQGQIDVVDCGDAGTCATGDDTVAPGPVDCLVDAWTTCTPARLSWATSTVEGDDVLFALVVLPGDDACTVTAWGDDRADAFGGEVGVRRRTCDGLARSTSGCPGVDATRCDEAVQVR